MSRTSTGSRSLLAAMTVVLTLALALLEPTNAPIAIRLTVALGLAVCGFGLSLRSPVMALALLGGPALLGPAARIELGAISLNAGDGYLAAIGLGLLVGGHLVFPRAPDTRWLAGLTIPVVMTSWIVSRNSIALLPSIVGLAQTAVAYLLTACVVRTERSVWTILRGWLFAVTISSALVIAAYRMGIPLLVGAELQYGEQYGELILSETTLYRATFFVTGFIFPLAAALIGALGTLLGRRRSAAAIAGLIVAALLNAVAAVLLGSMTALFAVAIVAAVVLVIAVVLLQRVATAAAVVTVAVVAAAGGAILIAQVMPPGQLLLLLARTGQTESLQLRISVWQNIWHHILDMPHTLLFGLGPDYTTRMVADPLVQRLLWGAGTQQQAVDSGYLYGALNFGLPVTVLLVAVAAVVSVRLLAVVARRGPCANACFVLFGALAVWLVMAVAQQHGISKPVFAFAQLIALSELLVQRRLSAAEAGP